MGLPQQTIREGEPNLYHHLSHFPVCLWPVASCKHVLFLFFEYVSIIFKS